MPAGEGVADLRQTGSEHARIGRVLGVAAIGVGAATVDGKRGDSNQGHHAEDDQDQSLTARCWWRLRSSRARRCFMAPDRSCKIVSETVAWR
jgi:hypothetical protein